MRGLNPGDAGYLRAALARAEEGDLLLDAGELPAYGASATYRNLALDSNRPYGLLLLVDGDRQQMFSSFAAANPGGLPQMVSLGNAANGMVVGVEDIGIGSGLSDGDYNDLIVAINRLNVPLF